MSLKAIALRTRKLRLQEIRPGFSSALVIAGLALVAFSSNLLAAVSEDRVFVNDSRELARALRHANRSGGDTTIVLEDGIYTLSNGLMVRASDIALVSKSGDRDAVVIEGDAMSADARVGNVITVSADRFTLDGITLQKARYHLIQIKGEHDADSVKITNCVLRDSYQQLLKVTQGRESTRSASDDGTVEGCLFEYSAGVGPQYYIGGIDAHGAKDWVVRNNTFRNIISPGQSVAEYAIHFWNGSAHNIVEKNRIVDCDRGIGFGLGERGNVGGIIRNNMIFHGKDKGRFADVGIAIHNSPGSQIYNNTIYQAHAYPSAIEYRFENTSGVLIANNLTNRSIRSLAGASADLNANLTQVTPDVFVNLADGDMHLRSGLSEIIDRGVSVSSLVDDFDGQIRPQGKGIEIGADETSGPTRPHRESVR